VAAEAPAAAPTTPAPATSAAEPAPSEITVHGALREMMHMGKIQRRVDLAPMVGSTGLYGLGALEELSGEVTIWDGEMWISKPDGQGAATHGQVPQTSDGATLLVSTTVKAWQERPIAEAVPFAQLDAFIEAQAKAAGIDTSEAFPFRIESSPSRLDWHVIDGSKIPKDSHGHEVHMRTAVRGTLKPGAVEILGFYSPKHHAIFTHHDTNTHAHVIARDQGITGHVDHVDLAAGGKLFLPAP